MKPFTKQTKTYLMVLVITLAGAIACWFLLGQIEKLQDDSQAVANLPVRHNVEIKPEGYTTVNKTISLKVGQIIKITADGLALKLLSVSDSRCPSEPKVQCIWAGTVSAKVELFKSKTSLGIREVELNKPSKLGNYTLNFFEVVPKIKKVDAQMSEYLLKFKINN